MCLVLRFPYCWQLVRSLLLMKQSYNTSVEFNITFLDGRLVSLLCLTGAILYHSECVIRFVVFIYLHSWFVVLPYDLPYDTLLLQKLLITRLFSLHGIITVSAIIVVSVVFRCFKRKRGGSIPVHLTDKRAYICVREGMRVWGYVCVGYDGLGLG